MSQPRHPAAALRLRPGAVHLWTIELDRRRPAAERLLSIEERRRAGSFRSLLLHRRFVTGRAALRELLGRYLGVVPARLALSNTGSLAGKPALGGKLKTALHFNLSHSADLAVIAVARSFPVGVDIERIRSVPNAACVAARFFAPDERAALLAARPKWFHTRFLEIWTGKEAYLKGRGWGFPSGLSQFSVDPLTDGPAKIKPLINEDDGPAWCVTPFRPRHGFVGALATPMRPPGMRQRGLGMPSMFGYPKGDGRTRG